MAATSEPMAGVSREYRPHGDQRRIGQVIRCDACGGDDVVFSTASAFLPPEALKQMFERRGWRVHKRGKHTCPACIQKEQDMNIAPRTMEMKDRRKIFAKLMEVYDERNSRYCEEFTDNSVAKELGMPRKWVEDIREENFGPAGRNVEMDRVANEIGQLAAEARKLVDEGMAIAARGEEIEVKIEGLRKRLEGIEAAVGPRAVRA